MVASWDDDRGFGFITPSTGGPRVFVHISAFPRGGRPVSGCEVTYGEARDERGRAQACDVRYPDREPTRRGGDSGPAFAVGTAVLFLAVLCCFAAAHLAPLLLVAGYLVLSVIAFLLYGVDKSAAVNGTRRTPESTLHTVDLLGGWPGGLAARHVFRHKTVKQPFRSLFWVTVVMNVGALVWLVSAAPSAAP